MYSYNLMEKKFFIMKISAKVAQELAYREYDKFKVKQDKLYKSDFDLLLEEIDK